MTYKEMYKDEIIELALAHKRIGVDKKTLKPVFCNDLACSECIASEEHCPTKIREWANSEYVERCPFEKDELVEVSQDGKSWILRYFSHKDKNLYHVFMFGKKSNETDEALNYQYCRKYGTLGGLVKEHE